MNIHRKVSCGDTRKRQTSKIETDSVERTADRKKKLYASSATGKRYTLNADLADLNYLARPGGLVAGGQYLLTSQAQLTTY